LVLFFRGFSWSHLPQLSAPLPPAIAAGLFSASIALVPFGRGAPHPLGIAPTRPRFSSRRARKNALICTSALLSRPVSRLMLSLAQPAPYGVQARRSICNVPRGRAKSTCLVACAQRKRARSSALNGWLSNGPRCNVRRQPRAAGPWLGRRGPSHRRRHPCRSVGRHRLRSWRGSVRAFRCTRQPQRVRPCIRCRRRVGRRVCRHGISLARGHVRPALWRSCPLARWWLAGSAASGASGASVARRRPVHGRPGPRLLARRVSQCPAASPVARLWLVAFVWLRHLVQCRRSRFARASCRRLPCGRAGWLPAPRPPCCWQLAAVFPLWLVVPGFHFRPRHARGS